MILRYLYVIKCIPFGEEKKMNKMESYKQKKREKVLCDMYELEQKWLHKVGETELVGIMRMQKFHMSFTKSFMY